MERDIFEREFSRIVYILQNVKLDEQEAIDVALRLLCVSVTKSQFRKILRMFQPEVIENWKRWLDDDDKPTATFR